MSSTARPSGPRPAPAADPPADAPRAGDRRRRDRRRHDERVDAVEAVLAAGGPSIEFQPLMSLTRLEVAGYEALARFPAPSAAERRRAARPEDTEEWLATGREAGLGPQVEAAALRRAVALGRDRPPGTVLAVNLSPSSLTAAEVVAALPDDLTGLEIELTEQEEVADPPALRRLVDALRARGALIAVDDVGAGYAGLRRVMELAPDVVKLDRHLVEGVAGNDATAALVRAVVDLAEHIGARVCAEGVESAQDLVALAELDVARAQGWFVGRPAAAPGDVSTAAVAACRGSLARLFAEPADGPGAGPAVGRLVAALGDVRDVAALDALLAAGAPALGCSAVTLHPVRADGRVDGPHLGDAGVRARLRAGEVVPLWGRAAGTAGAVLLSPARSRGETVAVLVCSVDAARPWTRRQLAAARLLAGAVGPLVGALRA